MQEMLLFSVPGAITVLPALPQKWAKGSVSGLLARGGVEVSIVWNQSKQSVTVALRSLKRDQAILLRVPYGSQRTMTVDLKAGETTEITIP